MKKSFLLFTFTITICLSFSTTSSFKTNQKQYARVRQAYQDKSALILSNLQSKNISLDKLNMYIRIFKYDKIVELWAKESSAKTYQLIKTFNICKLSGRLGPKRQEGDLQIPEGFYHISYFNPYSHFYLSLGINYPNPSDKILGVKGNLGGNIFIHGNCVTIGCVPITDDKIKELYVYCVEAKNAGQASIPVTIFPTKLTPKRYNALLLKYQNKKAYTTLWRSLKLGYDYFNETKKLPTIRFLNNGEHQIIKSL